MTVIPFLPLALAILAYLFRRDNQRRKWDRQYRQTWGILVDRDSRLTASQKDILRTRVEHGLRLTSAPKELASETM